jgi:hypothetical protein
VTMLTKSFEVEVATTSARYINLHESSPRKLLAVFVRSGSILAEMENRTLLPKRARPSISSLLLLRLA